MTQFYTPWILQEAVPLFFPRFSGWNMLKVNDVALVSFLLTFNISPLSIITIAAYKQRVFVCMLSWIHFCIVKTFYTFLQFIYAVGNQMKLFENNCSTSMLLRKKVWPKKKVLHQDTFDKFYCLLFWDIATD